MRKINLWRIVQDHAQTLVDYPSKRLSRSDLAVFAGLPIAGGIACAWFQIGFKAEVLDGLLTAFSIFAGLLLNLLVLVFSYTQSSAQTPRPIDPKAAIRERLTREIHANVSFAILVSLAMVVCTVVALWLLKHAEQGTPNETGWLLTFLLVTLSINFGLTMMMVLKRMHLLIDQEFELANHRKAA
ncbi:MAG: hypothetical protein WD733_01010 [Bryobacterales bacterium]